MNRLFTKFGPMFNDIVEKGVVSKNTVEEAIRLASKLNGARTREDKMVWILRHIKHQLICESRIAPTKKSLAFLRRFNIHKDHYFYGDGLKEQLNRNGLAHFSTQNEHWCNKIVFQKQSFIELLDQFKKAECLHYQKIKDAFLFVSHQGSLITKVSDALAWYDLDTPFSREEGLSARHCGNSNYRRGDTLLSLREKVTVNGQELYQPHLTFVLNKETRLLGERKGRFNLTPDKKYHSAIVSLLSDDLRIKGFDSKNHYALENDFQIEHLDKKNLARLAHRRADLMNVVADPRKKSFGRICKDYYKLAKRQGDAFSMWITIGAAKIGHEFNLNAFHMESPTCKKIFETIVEQDASLLKRIPINIEGSVDEWTTTFSNLFIKAFIMQPQKDASTAFLDIIHHLKIGRDCESDLGYLVEHYPKELTKI